MTRQPQALQVAVGVLLRADARFLLTSRPPGKVYAGYWEFAGGKIESGESVEQALARELAEELGIAAQRIVRWREEVVRYPHALVHLHICKVPQWSGRLHMREGQQYAWQSLPPEVRPLLPGALPILAALGRELPQTP